MSIKEDAAVKLNEAYEAALITPHPVCRHGVYAQIPEVKSIDVKTIAITATIFRNLLALKLLCASFFVMALVSFSKGHVIVVSPPYLIRVL